MSTLPTTVTKCRLTEGIRRPLRPYPPVLTEQACWSLSSRVEVDMIAFKQPLLASDTQLQPGTSSDSKSTMMDCLAKTADQRRSKFRCVSALH
ncbi:hypothetical protein PAMP_010236 [Pampus punctatissimus]